jgi:group I intron endonuclease
MIIYKATNIINGKSYIGQTKSNLERRMKGHVDSALKNNDNRHFYNSIRKYGSQKFQWQILEHCDSKEELDEMEFHYIMQYNTYKNGYNLTLGGDGGNTKSKYTKEQITEWREKISKIWREKKFKHNKESIEKMRKNKLVFYSILENRERAKEINKESQNRPEVKNKLSKKAKERYNDQEYKNKWLLSINTEKAKKNRSLAAKNRPATSEETREKLSNKMKGEKNPSYGGLSEEHKKKISKTISKIKLGKRMCKSCRKYTCICENI